ncbi:hypothetical protein Acsp06_60820 [Actinomycetospora sp. NBRC 106375]|nr:hypothetical protein Acsp06_60820 [Actinomycetospora sp. NBRC 106375]
MVASWTPPRTVRRYCGLAVVILAVYLLVASGLFLTKDFPDSGPLAPAGPTASRALAGAASAEQALDICFPRRATGFEYRVVRGEVEGRWFHACYQIGGAGTQVVVLDDQGRAVSDERLLKAAGVWPYFGVVASGRGLALGFGACLVLLGLGHLYYRRPRPGPPLRRPDGRPTWWERRSVAWSLVFLPVATWISLLATRRISGERKKRIVLDAVFVVAVTVIAYQLLLSVAGDLWGGLVFGLLSVTLVFSTVGASYFLAPPTFDSPDLPALMGSIRHRTPWPPPLPPPGSTPAGTTAWRSARARIHYSRLVRVLAIIAAGVCTFFTVLVANLLVFAPGARGTATATGLALLFVALYGIFFVVPGVVAALLGTPLIVRWRDPARLLVLRPFHRPESSRPLRELVRRHVSGYGHTYTLADVAIRVRWYIRFPVLVGQLGVLSFRRGVISNPRRLDKLLSSLGSSTRRNTNWMVSRSKVFPVRCSDDIWQEAVVRMVARCDVVVVDVTEMTGNLAWELGLLRASRRLDDCLLVALRGHEFPAAAAVSRQLAHEVRVWAFDRSGQLERSDGFHRVLTDRLRVARARPGSDGVRSAVAGQ